jgi:hypothetical protein
MTDLFPLLFYTGLGGGLVLLGLASFSWLRPLRKPMTAFWLTALTFLWLLMPREGRWSLSLWSPSGVLGGQILLEVQPPVWWLGMALTSVFCGVAWIEVADRQPMAPLTGPLVLVALMAVWLALLGGSLLTTLAAWAAFDLIWGVAGLLSGVNGERVIFGLALHGVSSLLLWAISLFLLREGASGLWWLMWPRESLLLLLLAAALIRLGAYPFQVVIPEVLGRNRALSLVYQLGPVTGLALLYRLINLPGAASLPGWVAVWGAFSAFWRALMAWGGRPRPSTLGAAHALLLAGVVAGGVAGADHAVMVGAGVWGAGCALLAYARGRDARAIAWSWPAWLGVLFFLGVPPSPVGALYRDLLATMSWGGRALLLAALAPAGAVFLREAATPARGVVSPPRPWRWLSLAMGFCALVAVLLTAARRAPAPGFSWLGWVLWLLAVLGAVALAWGSASLRRGVRRVQPVLEFLDLQWLYHSVWRGAENLLSVMRISAEVVEGSGALLWSLLILLLMLLVVGNQ